MVRIMQRTVLLLMATAVTALSLSGCATTNRMAGSVEGELHNVAGSVEGKLHSVEGKVGFEQRAENKVNEFFNDPDPCSNNGLHAGAVLGGVVGGLIGYYNNGAKGAAAGAIAGAAVGGLIGHELDGRRCDLYKVAKADNLSLMSRKITPESVGSSSKGSAIGLDVQLRNNKNEFVPGTARLTPQARRYLADIAKLYTPKAMVASLPANATTENKAAAENRDILIVGHTDEQDNVPGVNLARLSQERARAVAEVFAKNGVPRKNINYQGAGDTMPLASNATAEGRKDNNRVQIVDVPSEQDLKKYAANRSVNLTYFASVPINVKGAKISKASSRSRPMVRNGSSRIESVAANLSAEKQQRSIAASSERYGFDGVPLKRNYQVDLGTRTSSESLFSFIPNAHADTPVVINSCLGDSPRDSTDIRNLATGKTLKIRDAVPGLYGQPWMGSQGHSTIALLHVYAPRDAAAPVPPVTVEFYRKDHGKVGKHPLYVDRHASVNVYRGKDATLYRVFTHGPAQCLDLYVPYRAAAGAGMVIYPNAGREYKATGKYKSLG